MKRHLLIVDPQNDFCDSRGTLFVPKANEDIKRLADMLRDHRDKFTRIDVTLDSHHWFHIAHPMFWVDSEGKNPKPFTVINPEDLQGDSPLYKARHEPLQQYAIDYVQKLKENGRYALTIWPPHCIIGSWGHNIFPPLVDALCFLEEKFVEVHYHNKGSNPLTEHYSVVKADVIDTTDPHTDINTGLLESLKAADEVYIAGEARTHCVAFTVIDILESLGPDFANKCILLEDTMSDIKTFEEFGKKFRADMQAQGMRSTTTDKCFS